MMRFCLQYLPGVTYPRNNSGIPSGWTVVEYSE